MYKTNALDLSLMKASSFKLSCRLCLSDDVTRSAVNAETSDEDTVVLSLACKPVITCTYN